MIRVPEGRHPATHQVARWFAAGHLPAGKPRDVSMSCANLAEKMITELPDGPELTAALRLLLQAKDGFVRAAIEAGGTAWRGSDGPAMVTEPGRRAEITEA